MSAHPWWVEVSHLKGHPQTVVLSGFSDYVAALRFASETAAAAPLSDCVVQLQDFSGRTAWSNSSSAFAGWDDLSDLPRVAGVYQWDDQAEAYRCSSA